MSWSVAARGCLPRGVNDRVATPQSDQFCNQGIFFRILDMGAVNQHLGVRSSSLPVRQMYVGKLDRFVRFLAIYSVSRSTSGFMRN